MMRLQSQGGGPVLLRDGDTVYTDPSDSHSLIVGDTGSMKTLRFSASSHLFPCGGG